MLKVENIVVNYVVKEADCEFHKTRKEMQGHYLDFLQNSYKDTNLVILNLNPWEVKGLERIEGISRALIADPK